MGKCYADYVCSKCCTMTHVIFEYETTRDALLHTITCPHCGRKGVQTSAPTNMKAIIKILLNKGYHVFNIYEKTLCIVVADRFECDPSTLPNEFILDKTEDIGDIIVNGRLKADDFEGIDKEQYVKESIINLMNWVRELPTIGEGRYIDLTE